ncbi:MULTISPECIES: exodeoxyribonuclease VII small subunit [Idiomarina]|jgi:exodeoxyribonuclease VII small subunit|uniref:Exodeoxyribonuclease 7 small subunit n=2 Tax=Idiomarina baltica TaxID=190892 RepID=A0A348WLC5_9GAMM|nr:MULTISPECIES: exodeoxyribonuclease VII small subunit [Idiomarina]MAF74962.1 exodeoxyribonuclease VII small subunit [Idiomarinaceae bacterium]MEC8925992.1 exodeoxyribonuclease VII small subunit [Pseudomonadota bacterium]EAQ33041.1 Exonuclease VII, small subunit [Idiomarina baltica OS145]KXS36310.1 MAG: exodeoxyribonuclease VII small subunit [Idiomarina sp. T82-3]MBL75001.1 exodeoxyribonuclease VII small subunit [Idiomarinaceae bacterium]|tara:strand:+ start:425 stop:667 length:243 start_codon:yes stop_codon:yes gene_type:complete
MAKKEDNLSFEQALQQLEQLVNELEQGDLPLETSLEKFEQAVKLSRLSQAQLQSAEQKVSTLLEKNGEQVLSEQHSEARE